MDESNNADTSHDLQKNNKSIIANAFHPLFSKLVDRINHKVQDCFKLQHNNLKDAKEDKNPMSSPAGNERKSSKSSEVDAVKQLQAWRDNPSWVDQPTEIKVVASEGSLCRLSAEVNVGLPPDSVYDIFTDPHSKKYFRTIKENISRRILVNYGSRQVLEVEQAVAWKFLWWSGTFLVQLLVDQNRENYTSKFKQKKTGVINKLEGCWRVEPVFVDVHLCGAFKPQTLEDYHTCTGGKGRIGSKVIMDQLFQPTALLTPPPVVWYARGIATKTTQTTIEDLLAEAARVRSGSESNTIGKKPKHDWILRDSEQLSHNKTIDKLCDVKERWKRKRRRRRNKKTGQGN